MNDVLSVFLHTTDIVSRHLEENSSELENIQSMYTAAGEKIYAIFYYEEYETPIIRGRKEMVSKSIIKRLEPTSM